MLSAAFITHAYVTSEQELEDALAAADIGDTIPITGDITITGLISVPESVTLEIGDAYTITIIDGGTLENYGIINLLGGAIDIDSGGSIVNKPVGLIFNNDTITNSGSIVNDGHIENDGELCNLAGGVVENLDVGTINNFGVIDNYGRIENIGYIMNDGWFINNSGAVIDNSGWIENLWDFIDNGTFINTGTFEDNVEKPEPPSVPSHVPVTDITGVPTNATAKTPLSLESAEVFPATATNKTITWRVSSAGTTGATISGSTFTATAAGKAIITATVVYGATATTNFTTTFTITVEAVGNSTISGPTTMTLPEGYAATSSNRFTITGNPAPTVTKVSGSTKITWNNSTKRLDIAAGLASGIYSVTLRAANGKPPDATFTFTLTVTKKETSGMTNFFKTHTYTRGYFTDVDENAWYGFNNQKSIALAYEYGLVQGLGNNIYNPDGKITVSGLIVLDVNVRRIYNAETGSLVTGDPWYKVYIDYAIANDMIGANDFNASDYDREATRAELAYVFSRCLPAKEYTIQNTVNSLPDVDSGTAYSDAIFTMYELGVIRGNDSAGTFYPDKTVPRYETAAIICLVILPDMRASGNIYG